MIYVEEIAKLNPDIRLGLCLYPYNIAVLEQSSAEAAFIERFGDSPAARAMAAEYRERYTEFWRRMHAGFPLDTVTFAIREQRAPTVEALRALMPERETAAYFRFDETLQGAGMTPDGTPYTLRARAGIAAR